MAEHIVLVEKTTDWKAHFPDVPVATAKDYLAQPEAFGARQLRVINLCRSYRYLSMGYYCSLLAEARNHKVLPSVRTINDLSRKAIYSLDIENLDIKVQNVLAQSTPGITTTVAEMDVFFGQCAVRGLKELARQIFALFPAPLLKVVFRLQGKWRIDGIKAVPLTTLLADQEEAFSAALTVHLSSNWRRSKARERYRYDLAILHNPKEALPPSDPRALNAFIRAGKAQGVNVELIRRKDFGRLAEFDALFIRETTSIDHYTYQFAKKAETEGLVVIDDPDSILRCTNKVYLEELLRARKVKTPRSIIVSRANLEKLDNQLDYPIVLKIPDGSFSRGVVKAENRSELLAHAAQLFKSSDLILAQEFLYTEYDWRVGLLDGKPLFACQYFMSSQHWQIYKHDGARIKGGGFKTFRVEDAPANVIKTALKAARLIGDGLYGVDLKQLNERDVVVMEVNDNPNIDAGVEDYALRDRLYETVIRYFVKRLDERHGRAAAARPKQPRQLLADQQPALN